MMSPGDRWANCVDHHPRTVALLRALDKIDMQHGGVSGHLEYWEYLLDIYFEEQGET